MIIYTLLCVEIYLSIYLSNTGESTKENLFMKRRNTTNKVTIIRCIEKDVFHIFDLAHHEVCGEGSMKAQKTTKIYFPILSNFIRNC